MPLQADLPLARGGRKGESRPESYARRAHRSDARRLDALTDAKAGSILELTHPFEARRLREKPLMRFPADLAAVVLCATAKGLHAQPSIQHGALECVAPGQFVTIQLAAPSGRSAGRGNGRRSWASAGTAALQLRTGAQIHARKPPGRQGQPPGCENERYRFSSHGRTAGTARLHLRDFSVRLERLFVDRTRSGLHTENDPTQPKRSVFARNRCGNSSCLSRPSLSARRHRGSMHS